MSNQSVDTLPPRVGLGARLPRNRPTVAVLTPSYNLERLTYLMPSDRHRYVWLRRLPLQRLERRGTFFEQTPVVVGPRTDLVHTFNQLPVNRRFVVSAEMELPRYLGNPPAWQRRVGDRLLASHKCRGMWPLSDAADRYLRRRFVRERRTAALLDKLTVFRGALLPPHDERAGYATDGPLRLLFVGGDGLRKGLGPTLAAAERLRRQGAEIEVTVIGQPTAESYVVPGARFDPAPVQALLAAPWVTHHARLPNREVRRLMGTHDLFVLPTMDESLGWVVAEAALSGTPAITTDVFALPELVRDGVTGWTVPLDLDEDGRWTPIGRADARPAWESAQAAIADRVAAILASVIDDRDLVRQRGLAARAHIAALYGVEQATARLEGLYAAALA